MNARQVIPPGLRQALAASITRLLLDEAWTPPARNGQPVGFIGWDVDIDVRNAAKPSGWFVLTDLLARSRSDGKEVTDGRVCVETNVRDLAETTGLSKDTVARAIRRLATLGLVDRLELRDGSGQFGRSVYRIDVAQLGISKD